MTTPMRRHTPRKSVTALWRRLTEPLVPLENYEDYLKSQWMAALMVIVLPFGVVLSFVPHLLHPPVASWWQDSGLVVPLFLVIVLGPLYALSRLGHYRIVAGTGLVVGVVAVAVATSLEPDTSRMQFDPTFLVAVALFASIMYTRRTVVVISIAIFLILVSLPLFLPRFSFQVMLTEACTLFILTIGLALISAWLRDRTTQHQTEILTKTNLALQTEIAERKRAEQQALELAFEREKASLLRAFVGDLSHDLMTPISVIRTSEYIADRLMNQLLGNMAALQARAANDPEQQRAINSVMEAGEAIRGRYIRINDSTIRLEDLIKRSIEMVEVDQQVTYSFEWYELPQLVAEAVGAQQAVANEKGIQLCYEPISQLPPLRMDRTQFYRVLQNLVSNALSFTPNGGTVTIKTYTMPGVAVLEVQDTGMGIPQADLPHIFERFYRVDTARSTSSGGSGLGLAIVQKIVAAHAGKIDVDSTVGSGTTFKIRLPILKN